MPSPTLDAAALQDLTGRGINVSGHFVGPVTLDAVDLHNVRADVDVRPEWLAP